MSQTERDWAQGMGEIASIQAALRHQRDEFLQRGDAAAHPADDAPEASHAVVLVPTGAPAPGASGEWVSAIKMVEKAAARIKAYERKFKAIEHDARAFMDRVDSEQKRLNSQIAALEQELRKAEDRALAAEADAQAMKLETWEVKLGRRSLEKKLDDAETEIRNSQNYLGQIEGILRGL